MTIRLATRSGWVLAAIGFLLLACGRCGLAQEDVDDGNENTEDQSRPKAPPGDPDPLQHNLAFSLPVVAIFLAIVVIFVVVVCVVYKGRYGDFCCLKVRMRYRVEPPREEDGGESGTSLPEYETPKAPPNGLSPPDYTDALQDAVITGEPQEEKEMEEIPLSSQDPAEPAEASDDESSESYDDRTPLAP